MYPLKNKRNTLCTTCSYISKHYVRCKHEIKSDNDDMYSILEKVKFDHVDNKEEHRHEIIHKSI